ncbi:Hsp20/alpha crystallin family protein [Roseateles chitosanitabidus]|uniref:Hsp20/alpha crystallin family protein n=1 Tax=Roseateles chitosanitabidus TaxID=65048 RepID=UPI00082BF6DC|nr:Hsp20/alpha crystallin family protein [Roseateles chitosanitabidus]
MYHRLFARDLFNEFDRVQREVSGLLEAQRGTTARGGFPALNVGLSDEAVEVYAFAPGLDPASIAVDLDRGVLSLSGERVSALIPKVEARVEGEAETAAAPPAEKRIVHQRERFAGKFRRAVNLPDDIDPEQVSASYRDGVLRVTVKRKPTPQPRRIDIH